MSNKLWISIFGIIILACLAAMLFAKDATGSTAKIYSSGELVEAINLSAVQKAYNHVVYNKMTDAVNTVEVETGRVRVIESSCKDKTCIHQGWISGPLRPIICLPNGLVIQIESDSDIDGVVG